MIALHALGVGLYGGGGGGVNVIRDPGVLSAVTHRPRFKYAYESAGIAECAASYCHGFATSQAFLDGNKRTAASCTVAFLCMNGLALEYDGDEFRDVVLDAANRRATETEVAEWIGGRLRPL